MLLEEAAMAKNFYLKIKLKKYKHEGIAEVSWKKSWIKVDLWKNVKLI